MRCEGHNLYTRDAHANVGACYNCCDRCNYDRHVCGGCGERVTHDGLDYIPRSIPLTTATVMNKSTVAFWPPVVLGPRVKHDCED